MHPNAVVSLSISAPIAVITVASPPVNALSTTVREGLLATLGVATANPVVNAIVLICAGRTFFAGADIREFDKPFTEPSLRTVIGAIESSPKPVIAAIHGTALGGGLEVALGCHYRIAARSAKVGLPEVQLGLLPGAGGTQRLPRLVGVEAALDIIVSGRHVAAGEALELGLLDVVCVDGELRARALEFARDIVDQHQPLRRIREHDDEVRKARGRPQIFAEFRGANTRRMRGLLAPEYCIRCIEAAVNEPFETGLELEAKLVAELVTGEQSRAQRYAFFAQRQAVKVSGIPQDTPSAPLRCVGIVGAGTMGGGIAMNFLNAGVAVKIVDVSREALERGIEVIRRNYDITAAKGKLSAADIDQRMRLLSGGVELEALGDRDLIIEAVFEDLALKQAVFRRLDKVAQPGAILASNTSYLDINEIAAVTSRPGQVIGLHFFSPANVMKLLEIVRGSRTSAHVVAAALALAKLIGKVPVVVGVWPWLRGQPHAQQTARASPAIGARGRDAVGCRSCTV
ncbi:MAG TPA: 3-hydroxyacyl-CoA dehydrogenase NAD-binding domain-containing protein [Steroidobacteraceae bacterium]|nr:3-hydroxyacyl-CoA dehydrogenase NAD-binding domain-containing protein [Steroidobacteraceae bacterium]